MPVAHDRDPREEVRGEGKVVQHRDDRGPVAAVEVGQQLHDFDLVADVEVRRRFVEHEDRSGLGHRDGDEDELPLAHGQLANVPAGEVRDADPLHRRRRRRRGLPDADR